MKAAQKVLIAKGLSMVERGNKLLKGLSLLLIVSIFGASASASAFPRSHATTICNLLLLGVLGGGGYWVYDEIKRDNQATEQARNELNRPIKKAIRPGTYFADGRYIQIEHGDEVTVRIFGNDLYARKVPAVSFEKDQDGTARAVFHLNWYDGVLSNPRWVDATITTSPGGSLEIQLTGKMYRLDQYGRSKIEPDIDVSIKGVMEPR